MKSFLAGLVVLMLVGCFGGNKDEGACNGTDSEVVGDNQELIPCTREAEGIRHCGGSAEYFYVCVDCQWTQGSCPMNSSTGFLKSCYDPCGQDIPDACCR